MKKQESQTAEEFAQQVQETIAKELSVEATKFTSQDKSEYLKRKRIDTNLGKGKVWMKTSMNSRKAVFMSNIYRIKYKSIII